MNYIPNAPPGTYDHVARSCLICKEDQISFYARKGSGEKLRCTSCGNEEGAKPVVTVALRYPDTLRELQREVEPWFRHNFPVQPASDTLLIAGEELGELMHAHVKMNQGIRGTAEQHTEKQKDAIGDITIALAAYCNQRGFDFVQVVRDTWDVVRKRDWQVNKIDGNVDPFQVHVKGLEHHGNEKQKEETNAQADYERRRAEAVYEDRETD